MRYYLSVQLLMSLLIGAYALSVSNPLHQNLKRGLLLGAAQGSATSSYNSQQKSFSKAELSDMKVYWIEDGSINKKYQIPDESKTKIIKDQASMTERVKGHDVQYQAELHPSFVYTDDYIYNPKKTDKSVDYNPANAQISVFVEFVPPQNQEAKNNIKAELSNAIERLAHPRLQPMVNAVDDVFKKVKVQRIVAPALGTTQRKRGIGYGYAFNRKRQYQNSDDDESDDTEDDYSEDEDDYEDSECEDDFSLDDAAWIQHALVISTGLDYTCPVILQDPAYSSAERSVLGSYERVTVDDDPDGIRKVDDNTLFISFQTTTPLHEMVWQWEVSKSNSLRPAAILSDRFHDDNPFPGVQKMLSYYELMDTLEREGDTDPFPAYTYLYIRKDLL